MRCTPLKKRWAWCARVSQAIDSVRFRAIAHAASWSLPSWWKRHSLRRPLPAVMLVWGLAESAQSCWRLLWFRIVNKRRPDPRLVDQSGLAVVRGHRISGNAKVGGEVALRAFAYAESNFRMLSTEPLECSESRMQSVLAVS
jgi:hypothetical protein